MSLLLSSTLTLVCKKSKATMRNSKPMILLFPLVCFLSSIISIFCEPNTLGICNEKEKHALLRFKQALSDPANRLSSWSMDEDCCRWEAVRCNNVTGRVVALQLSDPYGNTNFTLGGEISPSLLELEFLSYLSFSMYDFGGRPIPSFLGSMGSLRYLDLSSARFGGVVPHQLGNLSTLRHLDLGGNIGLYVENLDWISHLSFLKHLDLSWVDLHREVHWLESMSMIPSISELDLSDCGLDRNMVSSLGYANFTSLTFLDLSENHFNLEIPNWLFNSTSLVFLDLSVNKFKGQISESFGQLKDLDYLDLSSNSFHGPIPTSIGNLSSMMTLILHRNPLINGTLPKSLGLLSHLELLDVGETSLTGNISEVHFTTLSKLKLLWIYETSLSFHVNSNWTPPFQLENLDVDSCKMGPKFPTWLKTQKSLSSLLLSNSGIVDTTPNWFWKWASSIEEIYLSNNQISGDLSQVVLNNIILDLSSNCFSGWLPRLSSNVVVLNIANNSFSGQISPLICLKTNERSELMVLDISNNALSGELSDCWMHWPSLIHINLGSNNLSGEIPDSMGSLVELKALSLQNNSLHGDIHSSLGNCKVLGLINLSDNNFFGIIPKWIVERKSLMIIHLRSNKFMGGIPSQICQLSSLRVLDLANNSMSGTIPKCLNNISDMVAGSNIEGHSDVLGVNINSESYRESLILNIKGRDSEYKEILQYVRMIDLSNNNLSGSIPVEIFSLSVLQSLNLSHNHLTGMISVEIGGMKCLESLDLSKNNLSGEIPQTMTNLTFLGVLNLSYNNLSGRIPSGTQIQTFSPLSFLGNVELCGAPLPKNCPGDEEEQETQPPTGVGENKEFPEIAWFHVGMGSGFFVGVLGVFVTLFFQTAWRHAYFQFVNDIKDRVYVAIAIKMKWLHQKLGR